MGEGWARGGRGVGEGWARGGLEAPAPRLLRQGLGGAAPGKF